MYIKNKTRHFEEFNPFVYPNVDRVPSEFLREQRAEMDGGRLGNIILEMVLRCAGNARHTRDVDD